MAATDYGTAHLYGIDGTFTNATVASQSIKSEPANKSEVVDESGNVIERRYDDVTTTGSFKLVLRSGTTIPTAGGTVTPPGTGVLSEVQSVSKEQEARGHRMATVEFIKSPGVAVS